MRGGSKGLRNKHLRKINGDPLFFYTLRQAHKSKLFDAIVISTDSKKISQLSLGQNVDYIINRPKKLASDKAGKIEVIRHALFQSERYFNKKFGVIFDLDATSPLRKISDIRNAYNQWKKSKSPNLISVTQARKNPYFNQVEVINNSVKLIKKTKKNTVRRQDSPKVYDLNASIYIWERKSLLSFNSLFNKNTSLYIMPGERSIDIDSQLDFVMVKLLMKNRKL